MEKQRILQIILKIDYLQKLLKNPKEVWNCKKVNLAHLKVFGCKSIVKTPDQKRNKLDFKSKQLTFVGYSEEQYG